MGSEMCIRDRIWDVETDWVAIRDGSPVMSMGERCWENDYTFVWVMRRFPCFLFEGIIVILDVEGPLPVWRPEYESSSEMLGAFDFYINAFRERCGIYFNRNGEVCLELPWNKRYRGNVIKVQKSTTVSYTHLTLPTNREV